MKTKKIKNLSKKELLQLRDEQVCPNSCSECTFGTFKNECYFLRKTRYKDSDFSEVRNRLVVLDSE